MRLHRLTGLEQDKIVAEYRELLESIRDLSDILARPERLTEVVRAELLEMRDSYGDARRTEINRDHLNLTTEDLIEPQDVVVTLSHAGYAKSPAGLRLPGAAARRSRQDRHRGQGRGLHREAVRRAHARHAAVLLQPRQGLLAARSSSCRRPGAARAASRSSTCCRWRRARRSTRCCRSSSSTSSTSCSWRPASGTVKKTPLAAFSRPRATRHHRRRSARRRPAGRRGAHRRQREIMLCTSGGKAIRFHEEEVRPMGREAAGVRGVRLGRRPGADRADRARRGPRAHGLRDRLRQAHAAR